MNSLLPDGNQTTVTPAAAGPAWDEAFVRVESYLRAHHLEGRLLLNQVVADIIKEARGLRSEEEPVSVAMRVTHQRIGDWLSRAGETGDWSDVRVRQQGRLALVLGDLPGRWSNYFLSNDSIPAELADALASGVLKPGPQLRFKNMPPAPLEFGFNDPGKPGFARKNAGVVLREAAMWLSLVGFFGAAWAASH